MKPYKTCKLYFHFGTYARINANEYVCGIGDRILNDKGIAMRMAQARRAFHITTDGAIYFQLSTSCVSLPKNKTHYQTPFAHSVNILNTLSTVKMDNAYFSPSKCVFVENGFYECFNVKQC